MKKIKVLYINHEREGIAGSGYSLLNLIHSLGDEVEPIVLCRRKEQTVFFESYGIRCLYHDFRTAIISKDASSFEKARQFMAICVKSISTNVAALNYLEKELKNEHIDIVHINSSTATLGLDIARRLGAKSIWHLRECADIFNWFYGIGGMIKKFRKANYRIAISKAVYSSWELPGLENSVCLWDAVRPEKEISLIEEKENYFFHAAATLGFLKGTDIAIKAFLKSGLYKNGFQLKIVGTMPDDFKASMDNVLLNHEGSSAVQFMGPTSDMKSYMSKARAFLMCSPNEGLGRTTVESMFYGCPVIAKRAGGTLDFMKDGETGFFYDTEEQCANLMVKLSNDVPTDIITNAQEMVRNNFTEEVYGKEILDIYKQVLEE